MKAAVHHHYGPPADVVHVEDVARPTMGERDVLVRVRAAGVNWADASVTTGTPYLMRLGYGIRRPRTGIRGFDVSGTVDAVGDAVTEHAPGDEVFGWCTGAFSEFVAVDQNHLVARPAGITHEQAAGTPMAGCVALQALRDIARVGPGDAVLINGASGGIGTFAVQIAKVFGADVTGVCSSSNVDLVRSLGADRVIDYAHDDFTLGDDRYDLVLDIADRHTLAQRRRVLTRHGTLIPNSGEGGRWFGSIGRIIKAWIVTPFVPQRLRPFLSVAKRDDLATLATMIDAGTLKPIVGANYRLDDAGAAIAHAGSGHARGKVVISVG